ncbi:MAG: FKBP-type peptidyl-prolyl cis-trans isomerase [Chitinophagaceae bacterium]|nr:FKBP-type peptidyl-prolyl cis-trans isomerase [Chitinophagaceae bacterium]
MKKLIFCSLIVTLSMLSQAQPGNKPVYKPASKPPVPQVKPIAKVQLKNIEDTIGYVFGINIGNFYKQSGIKKLNTAITAKAISDFLSDSAMLMSISVADNFVNTAVPRIQAAEAKRKQVLLIQNKIVTDAAHPTLLIKGDNDTLSYAVGMSIANFFRQFGIKSVQTSTIPAAVSDILLKRKQLISDSVANAVMNVYISKLQAEKAEKNIREGEAFLAINKTRPEGKVTESGLQYEILKDSTGEKPAATDTVTVHYMGTFISGSSFDNSYAGGNPISFPLNGVIRGWTEGLQLMSVGSKYKFYVPYTLAYGPSDYMSIPGGSMLIFEVELFEIKKAVPKKTE